MCIHCEKARIISEEIGASGSYKNSDSENRKKIRTLFQNYLIAKGRATGGEGCLGEIAKVLATTPINQVAISCVLDKAIVQMLVDWASIGVTAVGLEIIDDDERIKEEAELN